MYSINFLYASQVILDHIPSVLRKVFIKKVDPLRKQTDLGQWLQSKQVKHKFRKEQKTLDSGNVEEWDTTLLCHLLLREENLTELNNGVPLIGQKKSPEYKAVDKLRKIRNEHYGHLSKAEATDEILKQLIEKVKNCYTVLEDHGVDKNDSESLDDIPKR